MNILKKLIQKWSCCHDWERLESFRYFEDEKDKCPIGYARIYACKNCGKMKKIIIDNKTFESNERNKF